MYKKTYVEVNADFDVDGNIIPLKIKWKDGNVFNIDKIIDKRRAASLKVGGMGIRYTCRINGFDKYLFFDNNSWFVEEK